MTDTPPPADVPPPPPISGAAPGAPPPWTPNWAVAFGWNTMKRHPESILVFFVAILLSEVVALPGVIYQTIDQMHHNGQASMQAVVVRVVFELLNIPVGIYFALGMTRYALKLCRGETAGFGDLFAGGRFVSMLGASILVGLGVFFGMLLCIVPGVILALGWAFFRQLIVDRNTLAIDSLKESWRLTTGHKVQLLILMLFSIGVAIIGVCACGVGIFVAVPIISFAYTAVYLRLTGQAVADART